MFGAGNPSIPPLVAHIESYLGEINAGFRPPNALNEELQIIQCGPGIVPAVEVFSTLGLSNYALRSNVSQKMIRQELFIMAKSDQANPQLPAVLHQVASDKLKQNAALLRGEVIQKGGFLGNLGNFVGLNATLPIYFPEKFWTFQDDSGLGDVVFSWLMPIKLTETDYIQKRGWSAFEELLENAGFDLYDFCRPSVS